MSLSLINVGLENTQYYGLIALASYVKNKFPHYPVDIVYYGDRVYYEEVSPSETVQYLEKEKPKLIGISSMTVDYSRAVELATLIKKSEILQKSIIMIGGVHISTLPSSFDKVFDIGIIGEGEETLTALIDFFQKNNYILDYKGLKEISGVVYYENNTLMCSPTRALIKSLDDLPLPHPDYARLNVSESIGRFPFTKNKYAVMLTSRGCPYQCVFCSTSKFWGSKVRFASAKRVADEIEIWHKKYGVTNMHIWDDLFTINIGRIKEIVSILKKNNILKKIEFGVCCRSNTLTEEICKVLKELNVTGLSFGFESGSPRVLEYLKKGSVTLEGHKRAILLAKRFKFNVSGNFIFGSPNEKIEDMQETLAFMNWCKKNKVNHMSSSIMTPFPGTEIWDVAKKRGAVSNNMNWKRLSLMGNTQKYSLVMDPEVNPEDFRNIFLAARKGLMFNTFKMWFKRLLYNPTVTMKLIFTKNRIKRFFKKDIF